ncbi:MAG: GntR family transcriptional regulator [bacterium]|jgi:GntR family transcriptional regulator
MEKNALEFNSAVPLYYQLKELLKKQILSKVWTPDQMIPSEAELSTTYNVSVGTVKKALSELVQDGVLYRKQGKGTFVARPNFEKSMLWCFAASVDEGRNPLSLTTELLGVTTEKPEDTVKKGLHLKEKAEVLRIKRVRMSKGNPAIVENIFLPKDSFPDFESIEMGDKLLYPIYEEKYKLPFIWADEYLEARAATKEEAKYLNVAAGSPVVSVTRISYSYHNKPVEFRWSVGKAEGFRYHMEIR